MSARRAAVGARRGPRGGAPLPASAPKPLAAPSPTSRALCSALVPQLRRFAGGPHFDGFPFGGGGFQGQAPPRGDSDKFYRLLGIEKGADESSIKSAYKKQAMKHHPDRGGDEATFKEISRAYEVLSSPEKKQIYDQYGEDGLNNMEQGGGGGGPAHGQDPFDLFSQMFGFNAGGRRSRGKPVTPDSTYELQLSLEEIYSGTARNIVFTRDALCKPCEGLGGHNRRTCPRCNGTGRQVQLQQMGLFVQQMESPCGACGSKGYVIPPGNICGSCSGKGTTKEKKNFTVDVERGVKEGAEFRFKGQADEAPGHITGDVVISIKEKPHRTFQRAQDSLVMSKKISLHEALCGFQFSTTFLDGEELVLRSSPGQVVKPGDMLVIEGKGMPRSHGQRPGHLFLMLDVEFPDSIDPAGSQQLAEALGGKPLSDQPPPDAALTKKLNRRQAQELKQKWEHSAREKSHRNAHAHGHGGAQQVQCPQQ